MSLTQPSQDVVSTATANEPGATGVSATPEAQQQPQYTPDQILELEQYAIAVTNRLKEYDENEDYKRLKNPEYREFWNNAVQYYDNGKKQAPPQSGTPDQTNTVSRAQLDPETQEILEYVRETKTRDTNKQKAEYDRWLAEQRVVEQKMRRDYGLNDDQIGVLAELADAEAKRTKTRVGFQQAYDRASSISPRAGNTPPTVGLRGDASMPGVPGPSSVSNEAFKADFHGALTARLRAGQ